MKINIIISGDKQNTITIQITNPKDPLLLYSLELSEVEYHQLKNQQNLLIDFQNFPNFLLKMIDLCVNDNDQKFCPLLHLTSSTDAIFVIQEKTQYRKLDHIILKMQKANDNTLKKYLSNLSKEFIEKYEITLKALNDMTTKNESLLKDNNILNERIQKLEIEKKTSIDNLFNEKNKEINLIKENAFKENKNQLENIESEKNKKISDLEKKIDEMQYKINELSQTKHDLEDNKLKSEINHKNLEGKFAIATTELNVYKNELTTLKDDNSKLNQKCLNLEKQLTELTFKNENFQKQLDDKQKGDENTNQLIESLNKQRESNEDTIKSLKAQNNKLQEKLQTSVSEINKGNEIIQKLTNDLKSQKSKFKSSKQALNTQEQLISQKQIVIDEQARNINDLKRDIDSKDKEINSLKNQISNYSMKLNENEKLIEENKQMILYLNKNINDNTNNPFRSRINNNDFQMTLNNNNNLNNFDNFNKTEFNNKNMFYGTVNPSKNISNNNYAIGEDLSNTQSNTKLNNNLNINNNYLQNSLMNSSTNSGMILPETNFCNYQLSGKLGGAVDKYLNNPTRSGNNQGGSSLLEHKYGNYSSMSNSNNNVGNNADQMGNSIGSMNSGYNMGKNTYNIEEEYPRQLATPQNPVIKK